MKIKFLIPMALVLCLTLTLCACGSNADTNETTAPATTAPATTATVSATEAATNVAADVVTTTPATEAENFTTEETFTSDDALELVKNTHELKADNLYYMFRGTYDIDGESHYAIDLRKSLEMHTTYISTYFVTLDGSEIKAGYIKNEVAYIGTEKPSIEVTEENAEKVVNAAYDFEEGCFLKYRGVEEIDGVSYFAVDLMKSLETNVTYLSSYFVTADGTITAGYYQNNVPTLSE